MWNHVQFCIGKTDLNTEVTLGPPSDTPPPEPSFQIDFGVCDAYVHERIKPARNSRNAYNHDGRISLPWKTAEEREELEDLFYAALSDDFDSDDFRTLYEDDSEDGDAEIHSILETEEDIWNESQEIDDECQEDEHSGESRSVLSRKEEKRNDKASPSILTRSRAVDDETARSADHSQASLKSETNNDDGDDDDESESICTTEQGEKEENDEGEGGVSIGVTPLSRTEEAYSCVDPHESLFENNWMSSSSTAWRLK